PSVPHRSQFIRQLRAARPPLIPQPRQPDCVNHTGGHRLGRWLVSTLVTIRHPHDRSTPPSRTGSVAPPRKPPPPTRTPPPPRSAKAPRLIEPLMVVPDHAPVADRAQLEVQHRLIVVSQVIDEVYKPGGRPGPTNATSRRSQRRSQRRENLLPRSQHGQRV